MRIKSFNLLCVWFFISNMRLIILTFCIGVLFCCEEKHLQSAVGSMDESLEMEGIILYQRGKRKYAWVNSSHMCVLLQWRWTESVYWSGMLFAGMFWLRSNNIGSIAIQNTWKLTALINLPLYLFIAEFQFCNAYAKHSCWQVGK